MNHKRPSNNWPSERQKQVETDWSNSDWSYKDLTSEWIKFFHHEQRISSSAIGRIFNCGASTVNLRAGRYGIEILDVWECECGSSSETAGARHCTRCHTNLTLEKFRTKSKNGFKYLDRRCLTCTNLDRNDLTILGYGISLQEYDDLLLSQNNLCAICKKPETAILRGKVKRLAIDHDHLCCPGRYACNKCVRGLLCTKCNTVIGRMDDNIETLKSAIEYLSNNRASAKDLEP